MSSDYVLKIPFRDVDMHGHVHNSVYICYFEAAITARIEQQKYPHNFDPVSGDSRFFIKKIDLIFHKPVRLNHICHIKVNIARIGKSSVTFHCQLFTSHDKVMCSEANIVWVCVNKDGQAEKIGQALLIILKKLENQ